MPDLTPPGRLNDNRVLIINDDGIDAPGLKLLEELARELTDDVWVVARWPWLAAAGVLPHPGALPDDETCRGATVVRRRF